MVYNVYSEERLDHAVIILGHFVTSADAVDVASITSTSALSAERKTSK